MNVSNLKIHHIGVAVASIETAAATYVENGYLVGEKVFDPLQGVNICFAEKTEMYRANAKRKQFAQNCTSHEDYLAGLGMELTIFVNDPATFPRIVQLSQKTNQFNLATRRLTLSDIEAGSRLYALSVRDVFGDNGICGAAVVTKNADGDTEIREFLLSCRVLGRGIEDVFLGEVLRLESEHWVEKFPQSLYRLQKTCPRGTFTRGTDFLKFRRTGSILSCVLAR